jgi:hypothetical protein
MRSAADAVASDAGGIGAYRKLGSAGNAHHSKAMKLSQAPARRTAAIDDARPPAFFAWNFHEPLKDLKSSKRQCEERYA